jgi:outer membrane protein OmpA-like peptidoglycan-associated protein
MIESETDVVPAGENDHWLTVSDLMAGLMIVFLFVAVLFMLQVRDEQIFVESIARTYQDLRVDLHRDLLEEFRHDLPRWNATIDSDLSVRFREPDVRFAPNSAALQARFREILDDFFPRYLRILSGPKYREEIEEIRIEGHTSSEAPGATELERYFFNMRLSQERTRSVLEHVTLMSRAREVDGWLRRRLTANGLSSSRPILRDEREDRNMSRRVEFRARLNSESRIDSILDKAASR